jgi:hypothetical protein
MKPITISPEKKGKGLQDLPYNTTLTLKRGVPGLSMAVITEDHHDCTVLYLRKCTLIQSYVPVCMEYGDTTGQLRYEPAT